MPTYIYETYSKNTDKPKRQFEVFQRMSDAPLTTDSTTGDPVRRIITGGIGLKFSGLKRSTVVNKKSAAATACGCATGKPHRHIGAGHSGCSSHKSHKGHKH